MNSIKVAIADDHKLFREGLKVILNSIPNVRLAFDVENGQDVLDHLAKNPEAADVLLLDLKMPVLDGMETMKILHAEYPKVKVLVLTMINEDDYILHLLDCGASGYLLKDSTAEELANAIERVYNQGYYFNDRISSVMLRGLQRKSKVKSLDQAVNISEREQEVLQLICEEMTTSDIADKLFLSIRTVESHRKNLMDKLDAKNTAGLVYRAVKSGLVG